MRQNASAFRGTAGRGPGRRLKDGGAPIGTMDRERVAGAIEALVDAGAVEAGLTPEEPVSFDLVPKS